ncbi:unnamed protein product [Prorocentrum cordatum]|uniref:Uncharacterized protein n=1 Tax=Prorocentrum cordatum TaxID=2364126 RepID=A0ABN9UIH0_9DINO|nr:unnamed protein product [Polarella glacialis]
MTQYPRLGKQGWYWVAPEENWSSWLLPYGVEIEPSDQQQKLVATVTHVGQRKWQQVDGSQRRKKANHPRSGQTGWGQKWHAAREILERLPRRALVLVSDSRDVLLNLAPGAAPGSAAQRLAASFEALTAGALEGAVVAGAEGRCCVSALTNVRPGELFDEGGGRRVRACSSGSQGCPWRKGGVRLWEEFMGGLAAERGAAGTEVFLNAGLVAGCTNPTAPPPPHSCISAHSYW